MLTRWRGFCDSALQSTLKHKQSSSVEYAEMVGWHNLNICLSRPAVSCIAPPKSLIAEHLHITANISWQTSQRICKNIDNNILKATTK